MSLLRVAFQHSRLLPVRIWTTCPSVDSRCVCYHDDKMATNRSASLRAKGHHGGQQRKHKLSSELHKLSLEDSSPERARRPTSRADSEDDWEVVFGVAPCLLALTQGRRKALGLFVKDGVGPQRASLLKVCEEARRRGVLVQRVGKTALNKMSSGGVHQGVCLQASPLSYLTEDRAPDAKSKPLWLVLDRIQDPMNLGAILRSAYFLGVDRVASGLRHSCPLTPVVSKASSGVMEVMGVHGYEDLEGMVRGKAAQGWRVVGTVAADAAEAHVPVTPCSRLLMNEPTLLLIGGEGEGLSHQMIALCQTLVTIPAGRELPPGVESLNVSVATAILLHSLLTRTQERSTC
ncbi:rRNA methyltransferase 1, mitochondrial [Nerophis lumbriciformis]|uniref:rRNA methyltransferase 1, mitochondrial n=1 Tax=Nerophis lumbriciformis TaxID=546530 RepID=UPI002ADFC352|nr:rRNA methyltransferase 1, mitochondrial-like [Nerophis lumbriciformis]